MGNPNVRHWPRAGDASPEVLPDRRRHGGICRQGGGREAAGELEPVGLVIADQKSLTFGVGNHPRPVPDSPSMLTAADPFFFGFEFVTLPIILTLELKICLAERHSISFVCKMAPAHPDLDLKLQWVVRRKLHIQTVH